MSSSQEIENGVKDIVIEVLSLQKDRTGINRETRLAEDLGADSVDAVTIFMDCEDRFGVDIPEEATASLHTVGDIAAYIENAQGEGVRDA